MTIGPREMTARRTGASSSAIRWARTGDQWSLAHHNLYRATKDATAAIRRLTAVLPRDGEGLE